MAPVISKIAERLDKDPKLFIIASSIASSYWLYSISKTIANSRKRKEDAVKFVITDPNSAGQNKKVQVDAEFFRSIRQILKIAIPKWYSKEAGYIVMVAATLFVRSFCDIWLINNGTLIESSIISQNMKGFKKNLGIFFLAMPAISMVNSLMKFSLQELKLQLRIRITKNLYDKYLRGFTYYKMSNLDNRITNADQLLTQDVEKFCNSAVDFYSNVSKPLLDIIIYVRKLTETIGLQGPGIMILYLLVAGGLLTKIRKPVGKMTAEEQKLEGEFRFVNSRLITNSEEVAFYKGNSREKLNLESSFNRLVAHLRKLIDFKFNIGFIDNIVAKYYAFCVGFAVVAYPFLKTNSPYTAMSHQVKMKEYYINGRMLVKLAEAIGRLVLAGRELTRLSGFTSRVQELRVVLNDLNKGLYQRTMVEQNDGGTQKENFVPGTGKIIEADNLIKFEQVPLVTPNGELLVKELNFEVKSGMNVLVCGPNGCGKSSLFRILGGLWPVFGGTVTKPAAGNLFYIPQRPYMTLGTLRDQVIYPDSLADMKMKGLTDEFLLCLLEKVHLTHILQREEAGWDSVADWMDVLSGGEKQRVAMARVFYHKPQFAILDECTSAVSVDVEGEMYRYCRSVGITLFTVSHRKSLWKHHEYYLQMDGRGAFEFKPIDEKTAQFGS